MTKRSPFRYFKTSPEIIRLAVMLYVRFPLSLRNVEDLLHERGVDVCHETVRFWWQRFGPMFASEIRKRRVAGMKSSRWRWHLDEFFVKINREQHYLWRAVDHEGLFVTVLGNRNSGKSSTWNNLFGATVRTGKNTRTLPVGGGRCVEVFLIGGSPEERNTYAGDILKNQDCRVVLCSAQYANMGQETFKYAFENKFEVFSQWLNPGYNDVGENFDRLGSAPWLISQGATISMRDAALPIQFRAEEIRQFIDGWASTRGLTFPCP